MLRSSECFSNATILVVAHRINTIIDCDMVMVLDAGKLIEYGTPQELLSSPGGRFAAMVAASRQKGTTVLD